MEIVIERGRTSPSSRCRRAAWPSTGTSSARASTPRASATASTTTATACGTRRGPRPSRCTTPSPGPSARRAQRLPQRHRPRHGPRGLAAAPHRARAGAPRQPPRALRAGCSTRTPARTPCGRHAHHRRVALRARDRARADGAYYQLDTPGLRASSTRWGGASRCTPTAPRTRTRRTSRRQPLRGAAPGQGLELVEQPRHPGPREGSSPTATSAW
jgi:hypothetical protein